MDGLTIGKLAGESGVSVETIRFYEREGLIEQPVKPATGYRRYPAETGTRVRFIRNAKELGFSLREIGELLSLAGSSKADSKGMRAQAEAKVAEIDVKIDGLLKLREELSDLITRCRSATKECRCPIVEVFEHRVEEKVSSAKTEKE